MNLTSRKKAFTLIEVLLVVVIIAILASIVIVALNPARQIAQSNNVSRSSDTNSILNAVYQYTIDNGGVLPTEITTTATNIGDDASTEVNICSYLVPTYLAAMPFDPTDADGAYSSCTSYDTGYNISIDANNRVTVAAPNAQDGATISVTR